MPTYGIGRHLEHVGEQRLGGIVAVFEGDFLLRLPRRRCAAETQKRPRIAFLRRWEMFGDGIEQFGDADAAAGIGEQNRDDVGLIHRQFERRVQHLVIRLLAAEVLLHQLFVEFDDLIENGRVRGRDGEKVAFAAIVEQAFHDRLATCRWED